MVVDDSGAAYEFGGTFWSGALSLGLAAPPAGKAYVSCVDPGFCMATTGVPQIVKWNGSTWEGPVSVGSARLQSLACATSSFCTSVNGEGDAFKYNGSRWFGTVGAWGGPTGSSCPDPGFCVATEGGGTAMWNGSSWSQPQDQDSQGQLEAVSCTSGSFCVAGDSSGNVISWNGSAWSQPQPVDGGASPGNPPSVSSISCVGTTFCVAVDNGGRALVFHDGNWTAPGVIGTGKPLTAVSCASTSFCLATDASGAVLAYR
jgi:hypothetical protein